MPANLNRFLPLLLIVFVLLFVLPTIFRHHSSSGKLSTGDLSNLAIATATKVDTLEQRIRATSQGYTKSVADLLALDHSLSKALANGVAIGLDVSTNRQTYYAQVASSNIQLLRARQGDKLIAKNCLVVKSASGVSCPKPPVKTTTSTTTGTTTTSG